MNLNNGGHIYVISHPSFKFYGSNVYKIGCSKNPKNRIKKFRTSLVGNIELVYESEFVSNKLKVEKLIFEKLKENRLQTNREFFNLELDNIVTTIKETIQELK